MSPLSDTTNLAPAMAGGELFSHIKYMTYTTVPTIIITLIVFVILGFTQNTEGAAETSTLINDIDKTFNISGWLFLVPIFVIFLIIKKTSPLIALLIGTILGGIFALIFQPQIVAQIAGVESLTVKSAYQGVMDAITVSTTIETDNETLKSLFSASGKGMKGMLGTIWACDRTTRTL